MVRGTSRKDIDAVCFLNRFDDSWLYHYLTCLICIGLDEFTHHGWLLVNFLEHVVRISSLADIRKIEFSRVASALTTISVVVLDFNAVCFDDDQLFVMDFHILVGLTNHGHGIRADHIVTISKTDQEW